MFRNYIWVLVVVAVLVGAGVIYAVSLPNSPTIQPNPNLIQNPVGGSPVTPTLQEVKTFDVSGQPFEFNPKEIIVNKGDRVRINFTNNEGFHDLVIDEYSVRTRQIPVGETDSIEFTADRPGSFIYYCNVGNHRAMGMVGTLVVK